MTQVFIGKRPIELEKFINVIKISRNISDACENLGFNSTVSTTKAAIREKAEELGIDMSHFPKYTKSEKLENSALNRIKTFNIEPINQEYYNSLEREFETKQTSFITYKPNVGAFLEFLGNRDFATVTITDIENYVRDNKDGSESTKKNCMAHIRSMMINAIKNNVNGAVEKVSKDILIWLI